MQLNSCADRLFTRINKPYPFDSLPQYDVTTIVSANSESFHKLKFVSAIPRHISHIHLSGVFRYFTIIVDQRSADGNGIASENYRHIHCKYALTFCTDRCSEATNYQKHRKPFTIGIVCSQCGVDIKSTDSIHKIKFENVIRNGLSKAANWALKHIFSELLGNALRTNAIPHIHIKAQNVVIIVHSICSFI